MAFHEFSRSLGRLSRATKLQPLFPIRPVPLSKAVDQVVIYDSIKTRPASTNIVTNTSTDDRSTVPERIKKFQEYCAKKSDVDVYIVAGTRDKALFGLSVVAAFLGLGFAVEFISGYLYIK